MKPIVITLIFAALCVRATLNCVIAIFPASPEHPAPFGNTRLTASPAPVPANPRFSLFLNVPPHWFQRYKYRSFEAFATSQIIALPYLDIASALVKVPRVKFVSADAVMTSVVAPSQSQTTVPSDTPYPVPVGAVLPEVPSVTQTQTFVPLTTLAPTAQGVSDCQSVAPSYL